MSEQEKKVSFEAESQTEQTDPCCNTDNKSPDVEKFATFFNTIANCLNNVSKARKASKKDQLHNDSPIDEEDQEETESEEDQEKDENEEDQEKDQEKDQDQEKEEEESSEVLSLREAFCNLTASQKILCDALLHLLEQ